MHSPSHSVHWMPARLHSPGASAARWLPTLLLLGLTGFAYAADPTPTAIIAKPDHAGGIYKVGEPLGWTLRLANPRDPGGYHYTVRKNGRIPLTSGPLTFKDGLARIELKVEEPAMLYVEIPDGVSPGKTLALGAAIDPGRLCPSVPKPADFSRFWQGKLRALAAIPVQPVLTPKDSERPGIDYSTIVMNTVDGAHIQGQLARPSGTARLPGLVIFQWASPPYPLQKPWVTDRAAEGWLALNIEPHDVPPDAPKSYYDALPAELKSYQAIGRNDREKSYFLRMYLSDYRAIEYLASRPDWDGRTLVLMGTSMGGQQSLCAAALNPRVTALIVNEPSGADSNGELHGRMAGYPNWPSNDPQVMRTALYFDTVNCATQIRAASLVSMGFIDTTAPAVGIWTAFNQIKAFKEAVPLVDSPHNNFATDEQLRPYNERAAQWLRSLRTTGRPPPGLQ